MNCQKCGSELMDKFNFCPFCGDNFKKHPVLLMFPKTIVTPKAKIAIFISIYVITLILHVLILDKIHNKNISSTGKDTTYLSKSSMNSISTLEDTNLILREANMLMELGAFDSALEKVISVSNILSSEEVSGKIDNIKRNKNYQRWLSRGVEEMLTENWSSAELFLEKAREQIDTQEVRENLAEVTNAKESQRTYTICIQKGDESKQKGDYEGALNTYLKAKEIKNLPETEIKISEVKAQIDKRESEKERLGIIENLIIAGKEAIKKEEWHVAIEDFQKVLFLLKDGENEKKANVCFSLGKAYVSTGKIKNAIESFNQAIKFESNYPEVYLARGKVYMELGRTRRALLDFEQSILTTPDNPDSYTMHAEACWKLDDVKTAIADLTDAVKLDPNNSVPYIKRGEIYLSEAKYALAISDFTQAIMLKPNDSSLFIQCGRAYALDGKYQEAIDDYSKAIEINPSDATAYIGRGIVYKTQGNYDLSIADLMEAIKIDPRNTQAYNNLGTLYERLDKYEKAMECYNMAVNIDPGYALGFNNRGILFANMGKTEQAMADFNRALTLEPEYADAYNNRGALYQRLGLLDKALEDFSRATKLDPESLVYKSNFQSVIGGMQKK